MTVDTLDSDLELLQRDQSDVFLHRLVGSRSVFAVAGEWGLGRVPSRLMRGREAVLLWSEREPAERWADVLALNPRVKEIRVEELVGDMLPKLAEHKRLVGLDWNPQAIEPELDPRELAERLRLSLIEGFLARTAQLDAVWALGDSLGPALLVSSTRPDVLVLPCWAEERQAAARRHGPWGEAMTMRIRLDEFLSGTLGWLERQGFLVAPEHIAGPGAIELEAADLKLRFGRLHLAETA